MSHLRHITALLALLLAIITTTTTQADTQKANGKLKVFVLAGQSNMVGFGTVLGDKPGTMQYHIKNDKDKYGHLVKDGSPIVRKDVYVVNLSAPGKQKEAGFLDVNFGALANHIGPEYGFGWAVGDYYEDPVLIIKCSWGGRSLKHNFLPPSIEDYPKPQKDGDKGFQYAEVIRHVKEVTGDLKKYVPEYKGKGYEIAGFGWHQGWNDAMKKEMVDEYESNLTHFVADVRKDLGVKGLPFIVATSGMGGKGGAVVQPQLRAASKIDNCYAVDTIRFRGAKVNKQISHWYNNATSYCMIGQASALAMLSAMQGEEPPAEVVGDVKPQ